MKTITFGKIILIGEHAVVYGQPGIAIPFDDTKLSVKIEKSDENFISSKFFHGFMDDTNEELQGISHMVSIFLDRHNIREKIRIDIESTIPNERGMGSSAAASVGVARALYQHFNLEYDLENIIELASISEKIIHGNPSGIDINTIVYNRPIYFIKDQYFEPFDLDLDAYLVIGDTGKKGATKQAVADVKDLVDKDPRFMKYIVSLGIMSKKAKEAMMINDLDQLGDLMNQAQGLLKKLTVSDDELDKMIEKALSNGAIGAKLTGGGRGGCMIALAKTQEDSYRIKQALQDLGKEVWITNLKR